MLRGCLRAGTSLGSSLGVPSFEFVVPSHSELASCRSRALLMDKLTQINPHIRIPRRCLRLPLCERAGQRLESKPDRAAAGCPSSFQVLQSATIEVNTPNAQQTLPRERSIDFDFDFDFEFVLVSAPLVLQERLCPTPTRRRSLISTSTYTDEKNSRDTENAFKGASLRLRSSSNRRLASSQGTAGLPSRVSSSRGDCRQLAQRVRARGFVWIESRLDRQELELGT